MWLQRFTAYLLRHRVQALVATFLVTFVPIIGIFGILYAAFVTLCEGVLAGAIFTLAATLPYFVSLSNITHPGKSQFPLVMWIAIGVAVLSNWLTFAFAVMWKKNASFRFIIEMAALLGVLVISVLHMAYPGIAEWWGAQLTEYYKQAHSLTGVTKSIAASGAQLDAINAAKQYATGLITAAILFNAILQLIVARWWQASVSKTKDLRQELHNIRLTPLAGILFLASFVLQYLGNSVILDIMPILYILFGAAGLSFVHYLFAIRKSTITWFWLALLYVSIIFSLPFSLVILSFVAMLDSWFDLRKRFKNFS